MACFKIEHGAVANVCNIKLIESLWPISGRCGKG